MKNLIFIFTIIIVSFAYSPKIALNLAYAAGATYSSDKDIVNWNCSFCKQYPLTKVYFY